LADEGRIAPDNIDAHAIIERFSDYITPFYPVGATLGGAGIKQHRV
jgi:hypothetical protein